MGMDVYGKNSDSEVGEYFRRNVWGWRPLWEYMEEVHGDLVDDVDGHSNSGDGLDGPTSLRLSARLKLDVMSGKVTKYVAERNKTIAEMPRQKCTLCEGTGIRTDRIGKEHGQPTKVLTEEQVKFLKRTHGWCNGCDGRGDKDSWEASYFLEEADIEEFAEFLAHCGGFEIC
jgi:DnaJ-class molecular chaperone